jgi:hypothetical protein
VNKKSVRDTADKRTENLQSTATPVPSVAKPMDTQDNIRLYGDKNICDGLGCFNIATHSIKEDGYDGTLNLCDACIKKFPREVTDKPQILNNRFPEQYTPTQVRIDQSNSGRSKL